jgi:hypothetical protein
MAITRREFLGRAASVALASAGPYALIDQLVRSPARRSPPTGRAAARHRSDPLPAEQHLLRALETVTDHGTLVVVPPLHHVVVTARLEIPSTASALAHAQVLMETALSELEASGLLDFRPSGLALAVAWGLPYFARLPTTLNDAWLPIDVATTDARRSTTLAIQDAVAFASDPPTTVLEQNDLVFVMASDHLHHLAQASEAIFGGPPGELLSITSIRRGFVDARRLATGGQSRTKKMAVEAKLPAAASIPDQAELFLGFTSTQQAALGQGLIANLETLPGMTDQWPNGYFAHGTTMHLSHIYEDLPAWYSGGYRQRVGFAFTPKAGATTERGRLTLPERARKTESLDQVQSDFATYGFVGHSSSMQSASRLATQVRDNYGNLRPAGTAIPQRADFNTLDNPFHFSADPAIDAMAPGPAAGVHFVAFLPTTEAFVRLRQAMDGQYGTDGELGPGAVHGPFNSVLTTTHRQNFLVPPRAHRSFPLVEFLD